MSIKRILTTISLIIIFGLFVWVVCLFVTDYSNSTKIKKLELSTYEIIDEVNDFYVNNKINLSKSYQIMNNQIIDNDINTLNVVLPEKGKINVQPGGHVNIIIFDKNICTYKRYNEGALTSSKVEDYAECENKSHECAAGYTYKNGYCNIND